MRLTACSLLVIGLLAVAGCGSPKSMKKPISPEHAKLMGTWAATDIEVLGIKSDAAIVRQCKWVFDEAKLMALEMGQKHECEYSFDPSTRPGTFELKQSYLITKGIYELNGDRLRICSSLKERPTEFKTSQTTGDISIISFKREAPTASK